MNILNLNKLLKEYGLQEFPLDFEEQLNNKSYDKTEIINLLKQVDNIDSNPLMYILEYNKTEELRLTREDILNIINLYPKQLLQIEIEGWNPLMFILSNNKYQELGLKRENIIDIIKLYPEQLLNINKEGWNPLMQILRFNKDYELGFNFETINTIYEEQINKKYNYIDYNNRKHTILFNEEYILNKLNFLNCEVTFYQEFLDYRKTLLEKRNITNILEINQKEIKNTSIFSSNLIKI